MKYEIDEQTLLALIHYLQTQPYDEVMPLIASLYISTQYKPSTSSRVTSNEQKKENKVIDITPEGIDDSNGGDTEI